MPPRRRPRPDSSEEEAEPLPRRPRRSSPLQRSLPRRRPARNSSEESERPQPLPRAPRDRSGQQSAPRSRTTTYVAGGYMASVDDDPHHAQSHFQDDYPGYSPPSPILNRSGGTPDPREIGSDLEGQDAAYAGDNEDEEELDAAASAQTEAYWDRLCVHDAVQRLSPNVYTLAELAPRRGGMIEIDLLKYVHLDLQIAVPSGDIMAVCTCKDYTKSNHPPFLGNLTSAPPSDSHPVAASRCIHQCLAIRHSEELLELRARFLVGTEAVPSSVIYQDSRMVPAMIISTPSKVAGKRAFVSYRREEDEYRCHRCSAFPCVHVERAALARQANIDMYGESDDDVRVSREALDRRRRNVTAEQRLAIGQATQRLNSVSFRSIPPPIRFQLPSDHIVYPSAAPEYPPVFKLQRGAAYSRCSCGSSIISGEVKRRDMVLFGVSSAQKIEVDMIRCRTCKRRWVVTDMVEYEIFVWSSYYAFTHNLLNRYTSDFYFSPTPFNAFANSQKAHYMQSRSEIPFCSSVTFEYAWFAFVNLQRVETTLQCKKETCGPLPETVVIDGVASCFSKKHLLPGLRPPNYTDPDPASGWRSSDWPTLAVFQTDTAMIPVKAIRDEARAFLSLPRDDMLALDQRQQWSFATGLLADEALRGVLPLFAIYLLPRLPPSIVKTLRRLLLQISMRDVAIGLAFPPSWAALDIYAQSHVLHTSLASDLPSFWGVVQEIGYHPDLLDTTCHIASSATATIPSSVKEALGIAAAWLANRGRVVYGILAEGRNRAELAPQQLEEGDWRETGSCYSLPQIRQRPIYNNLPDDQQKRKKGPGEEQAAEDKRCAKFYPQYTKCRQNGGIFAIWCPHSICYGFHVIRSGEGRDDLFSALFTRFPVAPKIVIYDYACAAAAYCWRREPVFFKDTKFYIDELHMYGHKTCSSVFFSAYGMWHDAELRRETNTSAAEHSNGKLLNIRKSISFMGQRHAIIATAVFVHLMNREKMLNMLEPQ